MSQTANWPCPPDCLTCRPCPVAVPANVSRSGTRRSTWSTATPCRFSSRSSTTSACASPIAQSTIWWVSALCSMRSVGSSAASRAGPGRACPRRPWPAPRSRPAAAARASSTAAAPAGSPCRTGCRRSRRGTAGRSRRCRRRPPGRGPLHLAERHRQRADPLVLVVVLVARRWRRRRTPRSGPETCTVASGRTVPGEDPHEADPSDVRVAGRLHHLGHQRAVGVAGQRRAGAARGREHVGHRVLERRREAGDDQVEQLGGTDARWRSRRGPRGGTSPARRPSRGPATSSFASTSSPPR